MTKGTAVQVADQEDDLSVLDLDELTALALTHHQSVLLAARRTLDDAIECGLVLSEIRKRLQWGEWTPWCERTGMDRTVASAYIRLATHREPLAEAGPMGIQEAKEYLSALEVTRMSPRRAAHEHLTGDMKELRREGRTWEQIDNELGVPTGTAWRMVHRDRVVKTQKAGRDRRTRAERLLKAEEEEKVAARELRTNIQLAKKSGGHVSHAYSFVRRLAQDLDHAIGDASSPAMRTALKSALAAAHVAEDEIVRAIRMERAT